MLGQRQNRPAGDRRPGGHPPFSTGGSHRYLERRRAGASGPGRSHPARAQRAPCGDRGEDGGPLGKGGPRLPAASPAAPALRPPAEPGEAEPPSPRHLREEEMGLSSQHPLP